MQICKYLSTKEIEEISSFFVNYYYFTFTYLFKMYSHCIFWLVFIGFVGDCVSNIQKTADCGACRLLILELEHSIGEVDPKKTIEVGSFRVDPNGNQRLSEIPYARSEVHLHELIEKVCDRSERYGLVDHPTNGRRVFAKLDELLGSSKQMIVETTVDSVKRKLKSSCENLLEDHEEDLIKFLGKETKEPVLEFCYKRLGLCEKEDLEPFPRDRDEEIEKMVKAAAADGKRKNTKSKSTSTDDEL